MNSEALINYIQTTPLTWLIATQAAFKLGIIIYEKCNKEPILDFPKSSENWEIIVPESINEINLNYLKKYLNIK